DRCGVEPASDLRHLMRTWGRVVRFEVHKHVAQSGKLLQQLTLGRVPDAATVGNSASCGNLDVNVCETLEARFAHTAHLHAEYPVDFQDRDTHFGDQVLIRLSIHQLVGAAAQQAAGSPNNSSYNDQ